MLTLWKTGYSTGQCTLHHTGNLKKNPAHCYILTWMKISAGYPNFNFFV
jgi:hypothetical protein